MTRTFQLLLVLCGVLLFAVDLLLGEQIRRSKFEKYLRAANVTPMDVALLKANIQVVRSFMSFEVPTVYYDSSCTCFIAHATINSELMKGSLDKVRTTLMASALTVRHALEFEFPELTKLELSNSGTDRDFKMTFFALNLKNPDASHDLAEYVDGKILFK